MIESIRSASADLVGTINAAALELDGVGRADLTAATANLNRAAGEATARLQAAADAVRGTFANLLAGFQQITARLSADLAAPAAPKPSAPPVPSAVVQPVADAAEAAVVRQELAAWTTGEGVSVTQGEQPLPVNVLAAVVQSAACKPVEKPQEGETADAASPAQKPTAPNGSTPRTSRRKRS